VAQVLDPGRWGKPKLFREKLDDGRPEIVEEQVTLLLASRQIFAEDVL
jgi:hypothetical protein